MATTEKVHDTISSNSAASPIEGNKTYNRSSGSVASPSDDVSKAEYNIDSESSDDEKEGHAAVSRIDVINNVMSTYGRRTIFNGRVKIEPLKLVLLFLLFVQGYATGLDGILSGTWQTYASNQFKQAAESGSINTVKAVIAAAVLVPYARLSDKFGRIEVWMLAVLIFIVGRVVTAATPTFGGLFAGVIIWEFGYAGFRMLATALLADLSSLRDRTFFMNIYLIPIIINLWISGDIVQDLIGKDTKNWRWGFGMFAIIVPIVTWVLLIPYGMAETIAWRKKILPPMRFRKQGQTRRGAFWELIQDLDIVGILLFAAILVLILLPLTIAGGYDNKWRRAYIIAMICVGGGLIPFFLIWEWRFAKVPFIPKQRLEPTFYIAMALEFCWRLALSCELNYVRFVLLVAFNQSQKSTQRLGQLYDFMQACTNIGVGIILHFYPHPKVFVVCGSLIGLLGMGLMYKYRVAYDGISGYIGADVLVGLGGGMMRYPMYTLVHAGIPHNQMAVATGFMMTMYQVGAAVGACIGTAVWTQKLADKLVQELGKKLGMEVYKSPLNFIKKYPLHSPERDGMLRAYSYIQRLLIIISISFSALCVVLTFFLRSYSVGKGQSLTDEEREEEIKKIKSRNFIRNLIGF